MSQDSSETTYYVNENISSSGDGLSEKTPFNTIQGAVTAAKSGDTIKLLSDISSSSSKIEIKEKSIILDLNGKTLNTSGSNRIEVADNGNLKIIDSETRGTIKHIASSSDNSAIKVCGTSGKIATLTLDKCILISECYESEILIGGYGIFASNYSKVICGSSGASDSNVSISAGISAISGNGLMESCDVTIHSGEYRSETSAAIYFPSTDKLNVTGGKFIGKTGFDIRAGTVSISNAEIVASGSASDDLKIDSDGPISWGIGVAVFDNSAYGNEISISINDVKFNCNTCDIYVGQHPVTGSTTKPTSFSIGSGSQNLPNGNISVTVQDLFMYKVSNSNTSHSIGCLAVDLTSDGFEFVNGTTIGSACTFTIEGNATIKGDAIVSNNGVLTNKGTITGSGKLNGSSEILIDLVSGTISGITLELSDTNGCKAIAVSTLATGKITIEDCTINGMKKSTPDSGIYANLHNSSNVSIKNVTFINFANPIKNPLPINVDILSTKAKIKISECTFKDCNRSNNVLFDAYVNTTIGTNQNIDFDCNTSVCIWSSSIDNTFSIPANVTFTNKSILTIDKSTSLIVDGKLIYDGIYNDEKDNVKTLNSGIIIKISGSGSFEVKNITFKTKGLYIEGANDVTVQNCNFTNISQTLVSSDSNADFMNGISLINCRGDLTIQNNIISGEDVAVNTTAILNPGHVRGILIMGCGDSDDDKLIIKGNSISNISYNAIQISKLCRTNPIEVKFGTIEISNNKISEWDIDCDGISSGYGSGRAIRIEMGSVTTNIIITNNEFAKNYGTNPTFRTTGDDKNKYDDGNVLKVTVADNGIVNVTLKDNTLNDRDLSSNSEYVIFPKSSSGATISAAEGDIYGKNISELSTGLSFTPINNSDYSFKVNGTLKYVTGYTGFWDGNAAMQSGYYLPFKITLPSDGIYTNISMTLIGKDTKVISSASSEIRDSEIDVVFFITGEFDRIEVVIDYDGTNTTIRSSSYLIDLSGLEFKDGVITAPIADNAPAEDSTEISEINLGQLDEYDVKMIVGNGSSILKLTAENVPHHRNANKNWGYWVGVAIPVPTGVSSNYSAYAGWTPYSSNTSDILSINVWDGTFTKDEITYITFYFNAGSIDMSDSKGYIAVDWDGTGNINAPICYTIDLSDVTLGADLDVYIAPIEDHPKSGSTIGKISPLVIDSKYAVELEGINGNAVTLNISATDLNMHRNALNNWGYWVGVAIEVPSGVNPDKVKYGFGTNASITATNEYGEFDKIGSDNKNYLTFYVNAGSYSPNTYIAVDFDGNGSTYNTTIYHLDLSGVIFNSDDMNAVKLIFDPGYEPANAIDSYYHSEDKITLPGSDFFKRSGYSFAGWNNGTKTYEAGSEYTVPATNTTLTAVWTYNGGGGGGTPITPPPVVPDNPEPVIPDSKGNVDVVIDDKKTDELIHEAVSSGSDTITILDTKNVSGNVSSVTVSKSDLETISNKIENNNNINSVSIPTSKGDIILEKEVLSSIIENTNADSVSFKVEDAKSQLNSEQKKAVGDRPVYDINITAGSENVTSFNGKTITISLSYTLKAGEDPKNIVVYYVKDDGSLEKINCSFKDGKVSFETNHLSKFAIGYEESDKPVTPDTPDDNKNNDSNNLVYYAVAAIVIILIIIALAYYFMKKK